MEEITAEGDHPPDESRGTISMAATEIEWETPVVDDFRRKGCDCVHCKGDKGNPNKSHGSGAPIVSHPKTGKDAIYKRPSSLGKPLEDTYYLDKWAKRTVLYGVAVSPAIAAEVANLDPAKDKERLDELAEAAITAAKGDQASRLGTEMHSVVERLNIGVWTIDDVPEMFRADAEAYLTEMDRHGLTLVDGHAELKVVNDIVRAAGTFDMILTDGATGYIADLKSGQSVDMGQVGIGVQLATYRHALLYHVPTGTRTPLPDTDPDTALVVHLPFGGAKCHVIDVDIRKGWEAAQLAAAAKSWNYRKDLFTVRAVAPPAAAAPAMRPLTVVAAGGSPGSVEGETPSAAGTELATRHEWLRGRLTALRDQYGDETVAAEWPVGLVSLKAVGLDAGQLDDIDAHLSAFEKAHGAQFHPLDPTTEPAPTPPVTYTIPETWVTPDEGPMMDPGDMAALKNKVTALKAADKALIVGWIVTAGAAGRPCSTAELPSARRFEIARAMLALAKIEDTGEVASRTLLEKVMGIEMPPAFSVAAALGSLSQEQANELAHLADLAGRETPTFTELGTLEVVR